VVEHAHNKTDEKNKKTKKMKKKKRWMDVAVARL
jgi:hypothetical protein